MAKKKNATIEDKIDDKPEEISIRFIDDKEINDTLNAYFRGQFIDKDQLPREADINLVALYLKDTMPLLQDRSIQNICHLMNSAILFLKINKQTMQDNTAGGADIISKYVASQERILKLIGLDAKTLGSKKRGSMAEDIFAIVDNSPHFKTENEIGSLEHARKMLKVINSTQIPTGKEFDKWDKTSLEKVTEFLAHD